MKIVRIPKVILLKILQLMISLPLTNTLYAGEEEFYLQVLTYGTDRDIVQALSKVSNDLGIDVNRKVLDIFGEDHGESVYSCAVRYIGIAQLNEASDVLIGELRKNGISEDYREELIVALGKLKNPSSLDFLKSYYLTYQRTKRIRRALIEAWGEIGDISIEDTLIGLVQSEYEDRDLRARAILALGKVDSKKSLKLLKEIALNPHEDKILRMYSVHSLVEIGGETVVDTLGTLLKDETHEVAEYAVKGIAEIGSERSGEYLMQALKSDYDKVRLYAVLGLATLKYERARDILRFKSEHDVNERVKAEAKKALEVIQPSGDNERNSGD